MTLRPQPSTIELRPIKKLHLTADRTSCGENKGGEGGREGEGRGKGAIEYVILLT